MNKPFSLIYEDFKQDMANLINNSGLPPFIVETVLQNYLIETKSVVKRQYQIDKTQYEEYLLKESKQNEENEQD